MGCSASSTVLQAASSMLAVAFPAHQLRDPRSFPLDSIPSCAVPAGLLRIASC